MAKEHLPERMHFEASVKKTSFVFFLENGLCNIATPSVCSSTEDIALMDPNKRHGQITLPFCYAASYIDQHQGNVNINRERAAI